jgi:hypothetical protein
MRCVLYAAPRTMILIEWWFFMNDVVISESAIAIIPDKLDDLIQIGNNITAILYIALIMVIVFAIVKFYYCIVENFL